MTPTFPDPNGQHPAVVMHNMYRQALPREPYSGVKLCRKCGATKTALEHDTWVCFGDEQVRKPPRIPVVGP